MAMTSGMDNPTPNKPSVTKPWSVEPPVTALAALVPRSAISNGAAHAGMFTPSNTPSNAEPGLLETRASPGPNEPQQAESDRQNREIEERAARHPASRSACSAA